MISLSLSQWVLAASHLQWAEIPINITLINSSANEGVTKKWATTSSVPPTQPIALHITQKHLTTRRLEPVFEIY